MLEAIECNNNKEFKKAQEYFLKKGYRWISGINKVMTLKEILSHEGYDKKYKFPLYIAQDPDIIEKFFFNTKSNIQTKGKYAFIQSTITIKELNSRSTKVANI